MIINDDNKNSRQDEKMNEFKGKKLLIIGATKTECDIVRYAKAAGIYTIVADYHEDSPAKKVADKPVLINALDVDALVDFCKKEKVDGVITGLLIYYLNHTWKYVNDLGFPATLPKKCSACQLTKLTLRKPATSTTYLYPRLTLWEAR